MRALKSLVLSTALLALLGGCCRTQCPPRPCPPRPCPPVLRPMQACPPPPCAMPIPCELTRECTWCTQQAQNGMTRPDLLNQIAANASACTNPTLLLDINTAILKLQADQNVRSCALLFGPSGSLNNCPVGTSNLSCIFLAWQQSMLGTGANWSIVLDHLMDGH